MSGLAVARELRREGLAVTVMEQRSDVGGQWLYDDRRADAGDQLGVTAPVKVHSSMYASVRLIGPRESAWASPTSSSCPGPAATRGASRRTARCTATSRTSAPRSGLAGVVRLNTKVVRVAMASSPEARGGDVKWKVRSVRVELDGGERGGVEEVFDAVVVANGHTRSQGCQALKVRKDLVEYSPGGGMVGCGRAALDHSDGALRRRQGDPTWQTKSMEARHVTAAGGVEATVQHADIHLHPPVDRLCSDDTVAFADDVVVAADTVIYCTATPTQTHSSTRPDWSPSTSTMSARCTSTRSHRRWRRRCRSGIPMAVFAPWFFEAQARWIARSAH
ncbi:hypothetical protein HU200_013654 [Digitaria exilis]|uniref:Flavin-containing monooxygenase n=1 Tax=Digitaria exilis TaxID=1010633 RepID=A0A835KM68_9POAL|nr:hypothetical protein HU200_013654 [Digitaria exilis]